jgi:hypothetical protein
MRRSCGIQLLPILVCSLSCSTSDNRTGSQQSDPGAAGAPGQDAGGAFTQPADANSPSLPMPDTVVAEAGVVSETARESMAADSGTADLDAEESAVYAAVIGDRGGKLLLIREQTAIDHDGRASTPAQTVASVISRMNGVTPATTESFLARNATAQPLRADMFLGAPYVMLSQTDPIWGDPNFWQTLRARYPDALGIPKGVGYETFSHVGFNASMDQALVYMGSESEFLVGDHYSGDGAGYYYLLKQVNGVWSVDQKVQIWTT